ncbi:Glutamine--fructose-6-phosphate aminotransferase [isomerizing] [uncultured archaeon]|nr:Glutamine--fructose-6-phosphate aminotransferase [isomerizing] [uncultured archaeon]
MCGITGFNWSDEKLLKKATSCLAHRGPDQEGHFSDKEVSLGHRRLSIIDLSEKGRQPMCNEDSSVWIVFNGEIYNFQDIRPLLEKKHKFRSHSDTEVIIHAYEEWGVDCINRFNGMWAFCIYDKKAQKLVLSRDRPGKKPLYYYWDGEKFIFGSELKAILAHGIKKEINKDAIDFYLTTGFIPSPLSIYKNVFKVEPRQTIILDLKKKSLAKKYYYDIPKYQPVYDEQKLIEEARFLLKDATRLRLISDVPVGAFLSGGLDSSTVVSAMSESTDLQKLHTFSIGFEGTYDETKYVNIVKDYFKTIHHHEYFKKEDFEALLDKIYFFYDEPFGDYSNFPTFAVSRLAREYVTVSLSGDGGDEIFGGYSLHKIAAQMTALKLVPGFLRNLVYHIMPNIFSPMSFYSKVREAFRLSLIPPENFIAEMGSEFVYRPEVFKKWSSEKMREVLDSCNNDFAEAMIRYDLFYNTLGDNFLTKVDRASMANALEVRNPFLDYRFVDLECRIPSNWKVTPFKTKVLMRKVIKGLVPDEIVYRGKWGFMPPIDLWIREERYAKQTQQALELLHDKGVVNGIWYDFYKSKVFKEDNSVYNNYRIRLFLLLKWFEHWMK